MSLPADLGPTLVGVLVLAAITTGVLATWMGPVRTKPTQPA